MSPAQSPPDSGTAAGGGFERRLGTAGLLLGPSAAVLVYILNPGGHPPQARSLMAILALTIAFWVTEAIPLPATALLSSSLAILLGVAPARTVLAPYAQPVIFLFLGTFLLAEAFKKFGLDRRVARRLMGRGRFARSRMGRILGVGGAAATVSFWLSNTASAALMVPIAAGAGKEDASGRPEGGQVSAWSTALVLMVAYGATLGGMATLIGTPPNLLAAGFLENLCGVSVGFVPWLFFGVPIALVLFAVSILWTRLVLVRRFGEVARRDPASRPEAPIPPAGFSAPAEEAASRRRTTIGARLVVAALLLAVTLWTLPSLARFIFGPSSDIARAVAGRLPEAGVALLCASLLFVVPIDWRRRRFALTWREGGQINWGILLLFGGGLSLGSLADATGIARWVGEGLGSVGLAQTGPGLLFCAVVVAVLMTDLASNTASATLLIPIVIAAAQAAGLDPVRPALGVALAASCGFSLPVSTPPNAIAFGTGLVPLRRMIGVGVLLDLSAILIIWGGLLVLTPVLPR